MNYNNDNTRNKSKVLPLEAATDLLINGEYGTLSLRTADGTYGVPLSYAWNNEDAIYLHGALKGQKIDGIALCPNVSFCIVGKTKVISEKFSTEYESIILQGTATTDLNNEEKLNALGLLIGKYSADNKEEGMKYASRSLHKTAIIKISITQWSGKGR